MYPVNSGPQYPHTAGMARFCQNINLYEYEPCKMLNTGYSNNVFPPKKVVIFCLHYYWAFFQHFESAHLSQRKQKLCYGMPWVTNSGLYVTFPYPIMYMVLSGCIGPPAIRRASCDRQCSAYRNVTSLGLPSTAWYRRSCPVTFYNSGKFLFTLHHIFPIEKKKLLNLWMLNFEVKSYNCVPSFTPSP